MDGTRISFELPESVTLADFARTHALELTRFAYLITGDRGRAEDAVQDVLLAMYRRFGAVLDLDAPVSYARRAIVNAQISWVRRYGHRELLSDRPPEQPSWNPTCNSATEDPAKADSGDDIWGALITLPDRQRTVMVLRYYLGYSDRDIAVLLGCRESSVRSLASRAFATLRPVLRPAGYVQHAERVDAEKVEEVTS